MGTWGFEPWQNDSAADWADQLFDLTRLDLHVEETLHLAIAEYADEVRAAAAVLLRLEEIWPRRARVRCLRLAISQLESAAKLPSCAPLQASIRTEIASLEALLR